jgi:hypothetical protein
MSTLFGWHIVVLLGVLAVIALVIGLLLFAVYWVARAGARRGAAERGSGLEDGPHGA